MLPGHYVLVSAAIRWLRGTRKCPVVFSEHVTRLNLTPDAIGWYWDWSILVECKASRSDFFADRKKPIHADPDGYPGQERWYLTPPGLVKLEELPPGWGLAELHGWNWEDLKPGRVRAISPIPRWDEQVFNDRRSRAELPLLLSAVRRHQDPEIRWLDKEARFESVNRRRAREGRVGRAVPIDTTWPSLE